MLIITLIVVLSLASYTNGNVYWAKTPGHNLSNVIKELNEGLKIEWNAFVASERGDEFNHLLQQIEIPKIVVTNLEMSQPAVKELHNHQLLVIAFINEQESGKGSEKNKVQKIVKDLLKQLHYTHILWIYRKTDLYDLKESAINHWSNGYMNCVYFVNTSLYTYDPVPYVKVKQLSDVDEYCNRKSISNFEGYPLTFAILSSPPRCYRYTDRNGKVVLTGFFYKILRIFMDVYNFQFREFPTNYSSYNRSAIIDHILRKDVDFIPTIFNQELGLYKSNVIENDLVYLVVPSPKPIGKTFYYYLPFSKIVWGLYMLTFVLASCVVLLMTLPEKRQQQFDCLKPILYVFIAFLNQHSFRISTSTVFRKLFLFTLMIFGFLVTNFYFARLSSTMVSNIYEPTIETFQQFAETGLNLLVTEENGVHIRSLPHIPTSVIQRLKTANFSSVYNSLHDLNSSQAYVLYELKLSFMLTQQMYLKHPLMHKIQPHLYSNQIYFLVRNDLPYILIFNQYLQNLAASGVMTKLRSDVNEDGILSGEIRFLKDHNGPQGPISLNLEYFMQPFLLFIYGLLLSLMVFICEVAYGKYLKSK